MEPITPEQIHKVTEELRQALLESIEASRASDEIKIRQAKASKRLNLVRDEVRALKL